MEFLNKIIIRGIVGRRNDTPANNVTAVSFSVVTEETYRDREGNNYINPTWFNVGAWNTKTQTIVPEDVKKGAIVEVEGSIRTLRYIDGEGTERITTEVRARSVKVLAKEVDSPLMPQAGVSHC